MNTEQKIKELRNELDAIYLVMAETHFQQKQRDKAAFIICRELEKLENPISYQENELHWEGYEIRF